MSWTDERVEMLRKLWNDGLSASQVAAEIGAGITRNAVIGKIHRLGLAQRAKTPIAARPRVAKPQRPQQVAAPRMHHGHAPAVVGNVALALAPRALVMPDARPQEEVVIPMSERVTLMELRESMCRWPIGDPTSAEFRFCGARSPGGGGSPYCGYHSQIAYQPVQDRRRARDQLRSAARLA
ncbi:GcrA family cell cycle regulator [Methylosinus sp. PW1]|uniref:GcrA family cell cycle regulator n=1 Tax=Methylosinus sp. PW1 TaxID=107636 RepID=UPI0005617D18|nr:GcrA family cell cycle regulator [Methylosinus sp. PW1]